MSEFKYQMDTQSRVEEARLEGEQKGLQEGFQEGEQKGLQKGLQEGFHEGERKKAVEMAKALKDMGIPPEKITRASGLSPE
jgi:flagellar biosynthesis/type III secretory pathway protein FliH